jgi:Uma2 family endonuclease
MSALTAKEHKLYTTEELERLSGQGHHYELIRGELVAMTPAGPTHGNATQRLARYTGNYIEAHDLGEDFEENADILQDLWSYLEAVR